MVPRSEICSRAHPEIRGEVWTLFDYYGEPSHGWPLTTSTFGQFDLGGLPKAAAYWSDPGSHRTLRGVFAQIRGGCGVSDPFRARLRYRRKGIRTCRVFEVDQTRVDACGVSDSFRTRMRYRVNWLHRIPDERTDKTFKTGESHLVRLPG